MAARLPSTGGPSFPSPGATRILAVPPEPAEIGRVGDALARLAPVLDAHADAPFPPYLPSPASVGAGPLPELGAGLDATIDELAQVVLDGCRIGSPGFVGFITTGASTGPAVAQLASAVAGGQLSVTCFRYVPSPTLGLDADAVDRAILDRLRRETGFIPSTTLVEGRLAIRPYFINPRTTEREVEGLVDAVVRFGDELTARA